MKATEILHDWRVHLGLVTLVAIILRSIPAWIYAGWGNDFGIYYSITIKFLTIKNPLYDYPVVWGTSGYGSFPMLYMIILAAHYITGLSPHVLLLKVPPIIGGLTVVPLYFIAYELTKNRYMAVGAAFLLAINPVHVFQTSMPYFLTIGHFFLLLSIYYFIRWQRTSKRRYLAYLFAASISLLLSHHLSNYIYIISITGITFTLSVFGNLPRKRIIENYLFITIFSGVTFAYWIIRVPGMINFIESPFRMMIPWYGVLAMFYGFLLLLLFVSLNFRVHMSGKLWALMEHASVKRIFAISLLAGIAIFLFLAVVGLHGYRISIVSVIYSIPFLLTMGFMGVGLGRLHRDRVLLYYVGGWLGVIMLSAIASVITWASLEPWRHVEYMMEPMSIIGAYGIITVLKSEFKNVSIKKRIIYTFNTPFYAILNYSTNEAQISMPHFLRLKNGYATHQPLEHKKTVDVGKNMQIAFAAVVIFILLMTGVTAIPFMNSISPPKQGISYVVMSGVTWLAENGNKNYTVATDHKIGTMIAAYGFNSSFEYDYKIWNSTNWKSCMWELTGLNGTYPPIGYVVITKYMWEHGVYGYNDLQNPIEPPVLMTNESYEKFKHEPFELVFYNYTDDLSDWVQVYRVNWTYIYENINISKYQNVTRSVLPLRDILGTIAIPSLHEYTGCGSTRNLKKIDEVCRAEFQREQYGEAI